MACLRAEQANAKAACASRARCIRCHDCQHGQLRGGPCYASGSSVDLETLWQLFDCVLCRHSTLAHVQLWLSVNGPKRQLRVWADLGPLWCTLGALGLSKLGLCCLEFSSVWLELLCRLQRLL